MTTNFPQPAPKVKLTSYDNFRVVIDVPILHRDRETEADARRKANAIVDAIKRHVDIESIPYVCCDEVCRFCDCLWEDAVDEYGAPLCCDKALKEWQAQQPNVDEQKGT